MNLDFDPCNAETWTQDQIAAMQKRFPLICRDTKTELPQVSGECGQWISFSESLPDDENDVLITDGRIVTSALWQFDGLHFPSPHEDDEGFIEGVTHWMKYPEPKTMTDAETPAAHTFTVIGHYTDTGLTYLGHFDAETPYAASVALADLYPDESISISAVIEGRHSSVMEGDYLEDTDDLRDTDDLEDIGDLDDDETIDCDLCGKVGMEHEVIQAGWIPMYWIGNEYQMDPVCPDCAAKRLTVADGDHILIEPDSELEAAKALGFTNFRQVRDRKAFLDEQGLDAAVRSVVNGQ